MSTEQVSQSTIDNPPVAKKEYLPLPDGSYKVRLEKFDIRQTKKGDGSYASLMFDVMKGDHEFEGRKIFQNIHLTNPSKLAVEISQKQLTFLLKAMQCSDSEIVEVKQDISKLEDLLGIPIIGEVVTQKGKNGYKDQNKFKAFLSR